MKILFVTPEVAPFSKTGGLADVTRSLPAELKLAGHDVSIITPLYGDIDLDKHRLAERLNRLHVPVDGDDVEIVVYEGRTPENVRVFFLANEALFARTPIYGPTADSAYEDNDIRFAVFARAVCEFCRVNATRFDIAHLNDWQSALVPVFLEEVYPEEDALIDLMVVQTIHNLAYQGEFSPKLLKRVGLPRDLNDPDALEFFNKINYLKGGILFSDIITAVSPTYSKEILTKEHGCGLEGVLDERRDDLVGILNGVDYSLWDPEHDPHLPVNFTAEHLNGKRQSKAALQRALKLPMRPHAMLVGVVSRLVEQKGIPFILDAMEDILDLEDIQLVVLGSGDKSYENQLRAIAKKNPRKVSVHIGFDEPLAHRIIGGADTLLMPSRFEPCGLTQLYALKYATLPIAHATGGLADTIEDIDEDKKTGTGFLFDTLDVDSLVDSITRAHAAFKTPRDWRSYQLAAMEKDFSWKASAEAYAELYSNLLED